MSAIAIDRSGRGARTGAAGAAGDAVPFTRGRGGIGSAGVNLVSDAVRVSVVVATAVDSCVGFGRPEHGLVVELRPSIVGSIDLQNQLRLLTSPRVVAEAVVRPKTLEIHRHAGGHELSQPEPKRSNAVPALGVQRHRGMLLAGKTFADEICQHAARTDLDEGACTGLPHRLNLFDESHRLSDLVGKRRLHFLSAARVRRSCRVGVDRHLAAYQTEYQQGTRRTGPLPS